MEKDKDASFAAREAWCWTLQKAGLAASEYAKRKAYFIDADRMSDELMRERKSSRNILLRWSTIAKMLGELEYNFGKLVAKNGKPDDAKKHYADSDMHYKKLNDISRKLATSDELIDGVRDYSRSYYTLGLVEDLNGRPGKAREFYQRSREIRELALRDYANHRSSAHLQIDLLFSQIALGEVRAAMDLADNLIWVFKDEPDAEYRLACVYALAINAIADAGKPNPLTDADKRLQNRYRSEAIRCLQIAHDGGFNDFFHTSIDADLDSLRDDPRMQEFAASHAYQMGNLAKKRGDAKAARGHFEKSEALASAAMKLLKGDPRLVHVKLNWLCARIQLGQHAEALVIADDMGPKIGRNAAAQFRVARVYALGSAAMLDLKLQEEYRAIAFAALQHASEVASEQRLVLEHDLDAIRDDPRFKKIMDLAKTKR